MLTLAVPNGVIIARSGCSASVAGEPVQAARQNSAISASAVNDGGDGFCPVIRASPKGRALTRQSIGSLKTSCPLGHLGVPTVCGTPPGTMSVLVPLPLFMRKPCPPLPGSVVVSSEPTWPVTKAGPRDVRTDWPVVGPCEVGNATCVAEAERGAAPSAHAWPPHAWTHSPTSNAIAMTAVGLRTMRKPCLRVLTMSVSFHVFEQGLPDDGRRTCSWQWIVLPAPHIASHPRSSTFGRRHWDMCEWNGVGAAQ